MSKAVRGVPSAIEYSAEKYADRFNDIRFYFERLLYQDERTQLCGRLISIPSRYMEKHSDILDKKIQIAAPYSPVALRHLRGREILIENAGLRPVLPNFMRGTLLDATLKDVTVEIRFIDTAPHNETQIGGIIRYLDPDKNSPLNLGAEKRFVKFNTHLPFEKLVAGKCIVLERLDVSLDMKDNLIRGIDPRPIDYVPGTREYNVRVHSHIKDLSFMPPKADTRKGAGDVFGKAVSPPPDPTVGEVVKHYDEIPFPADDGRKYNL